LPLRVVTEGKVGIVTLDATVDIGALAVVEGDFVALPPLQPAITKAITNNMDTRTITLFIVETPFYLFYADFLI
jgi:hypothetical protein